MVSAAEKFDRIERSYKPNAIKKYLPDNALIQIKPELIMQDKLLTSDMIKYAHRMAKDGHSPEKILGTHNDKQSNYRSTEGFLLGWSADEALAAAVYVFTRHFNNLANGLREAVNTPGDSDSIATIAGALIGAYSSIDNLKRSGFDYKKLENLEEIKKLSFRIDQTWHTA